MLQQSAKTSINLNTDFFGENEWAQWARAQMNGPKWARARAQMNGPNGPGPRAQMNPLEPRAQRIDRKYIYIYIYIYFI